VYGFRFFQEISLMSGPTPKPDQERRRRNQPTFEWADIPIESALSAPALPAFRIWQQQTSDWWVALWSKGQAVMWEPSGESLWTLASLMDDLFAGRAEAHRVSAEIRQHEDRHGLNPKAMIQLRWRFGVEPEADVPARKQRNRKASVLKVLEGGA
jgi:hypothetical protein